MKTMMMLSVLFQVLFVLLATTGGINGQESPNILTKTYDQILLPHRTNWCELHSLVENGTLSMRDVLIGQEISVGLFDYQLTLDDNNNNNGDDNLNDYDPIDYQIPETNPSAGIQFLDALAKRGGFTWRNNYGILKSPDSSQNETWTGLLRWSVDTYDLVGDWYLRTLSRLAEGIVFPEGWYDGSLIMVRKKPDFSNNNDGKNLWAFTSPFTTELWMLLFGTFVGTGLIYILLDYINAGFKPCKMELTPLESMYASIIVFTGHLVHLPKTASGQIMVFSVCLLSIFVVSAYTANLASYLVIRNTPSVIIMDITDAIKHDMVFCVLESSTSETTLRNEYRGARILPKPTIGSTYEAVIDDECDIVLTTVGTWNKNKRNNQYNPGCQLEWVGRAVKPFVAGFSLRDSADHCSSLLRDALSLHMIEMKLERADEMLWDRMLDKTATSTCHVVPGVEGNLVAAGVHESTTGGDTSEGSSSEIKLDIYNMGGIFIVHFAMTTASVLCAIYQWFTYKRDQATLDTTNHALPDVSSAPDESLHSVKSKASNSALVVGQDTASSAAKDPRPQSSSTRLSESVVVSKRPRSDEPRESGFRISLGTKQQRRISRFSVVEVHQAPSSGNTNYHDDTPEWVYALVMVGSVAVLWISFLMMMQ